MPGFQVNTAATARAWKKAAVTGGAGFIGSHLVDALIENGYETHVVDNMSAGRRERVNAKAVLHETDIRNYSAICDIFRDVRYVFHLAALPRVQYSIEHPDETHDVNVTGTLSVLRAAKETGAARVVFSSSCAIYGNGGDALIGENDPVHPLSPYGFHKYFGEQYMKMFSEIYGLPTVSLRYFNVYGPRVTADSPYALVIPIFLAQRAEGKPLTITGDGEQTRDFVHVRDVVRANLIAAEHPTLGKGEAFNIGSGIATSMDSIAAMIGGNVMHIPPRLEPRRIQADIRAAKKLLQWEPRVSLGEGLRELMPDKQKP